MFELPKEPWKRLAIGVSMLILIILASGTAGYVLGMDNICQRHGAVLAKDKDGLTCLLPEQIGKICFDEGDPSLDSYMSSMGTSWIGDYDSC